MKKILFIVTFLFFATQIVPIKYIGYLCGYELCSINNNDLEDEEDEPSKFKEKSEKEKYIDNFNHQYTAIKLLVTANNKYPSFCIKVPNDYIQNILVPPPNC